MLTAAQGAVPVVNSITSNSPVYQGDTITLGADASPGLAGASFIRMAGIGANQGNRAFNQVFSSGDRAGTIARITEATYNAMSVAQLRATYDVLLFTWASQTTLNGSWTTRIKPYLDLGGSVFWEDDRNVTDLAPAINGQQFDGSYGSAYTILPVPILTDGIVGSFANHHLRLNSWTAPFVPYILGGGFTLAIHGTFPSGGRMIVQGPDQDYHANRYSTHSVDLNQYKLILNQIDWLTRFQSVTYAWTGPNGFTATGPTPTIPNATVANSGFYTVTVTNDEQNTAVASIEVKVLANPVANAGLDFSVNEGQSVTLDGSASAPTDGSQSYSWVQVPAATVTLSGANSANPTFTAPTVAVGGGTLSFALTVTANGRTSTDSVNVTVVNVNHPAVAIAGDDQSIAEGSPVTLNGALSFDIDSDPFTHTWTQVSGPAVSLTGANTAAPTFDAPFAGSGGAAGVVAILVFELDVDDGFPASPSDQPAAGYTLTSDRDTVTILVTNTNNVPAANAGNAQTVDENSSVTLDGTGSSDPDSDALTYAWAQVGTPSVTLSDATSATPSFTAPFVSAGGADLTFSLTVDDGYGGSHSSSVVIHVQNMNDPPLASAAVPTVGLLWPPNHGLVSVGIAGVSDVDNNATITITGVTQDEPTNGLGDGDTAIDAIINADGTVLLRAERSGKGNGRVYRVSFTASDLEGSASGVVTVTVPHSVKSAAIDSGSVIDSTN